MEPISAILNIGEKILDRVLPDPEQKAQAMLELQKLEQAGQLQEMSSQLEDMKSARQREADIATAEHAPLINKVVTPILALGVIGLTFALFGYLLWTNNPIPPERKDIIIYILGVLSAICGQIISYYFGSTSGSTRRVDGILEVAKKNS